MFVVKADKTVEVRPVTVAAHPEQRRSIASGLSLGERGGGRRPGQVASREQSGCRSVTDAPSQTSNRAQPRSQLQERHESVAAFYSSPGRDDPADGRPVCWSESSPTGSFRSPRLPEVDYPTIQVVTFYPGADPDVMASSVTAPLERQFGQVPGLSQMTSTSSLGSSIITLQFNLDQNIDVEEQQVQAAINAGTTYLPRDLPNPPIYSKVNPADSPILTLALTSDTLPLSKVEDLADTALAQKISQLPGVGLVSISGGQKPAVRIQANPTALASYGLSLEDVRTALAAANVDQAKGVLDGPRQSFTIGANDQLISSRNTTASSWSPTGTALRCACPTSPPP